MELARFQPKSWVEGALWAPDGQSLLTWPGETAQFWIISPDWLLRSVNNIGIRDFTPDEKRTYRIDADIVPDMRFEPLPWKKKKE